MRIADSARTAMAGGFIAEAAVGAGTALIRIYTGSAPANIGDAPAGNLLLEFELATPPLVAGSAGVAVVDGTPIATEGLAAGTAAYAQFLNENGDVLADTESVGSAATDVIISDVTVATGQDYSLISWSFTMPAGTP